MPDGPRAVRVPVDNLYSNWGLLVMASLAWTLTAWLPALTAEDRSLEVATSH